MGPRQPILLVTTEQPIAEAVGHALEAEGRFVTNGICRDLQELAGYLQRKNPAAAIVDIDPRPQHMLAELEQITARFPQTRFIVVSSDVGSQLILAAMQAGVRHFLAKSAIAKDLAPSLSRLVPADSVLGGGVGSVVTVLSASGGCGATTIAVNLANELHIEGGGPALLVDMDLNYGAIASYLGISGQFGLADVLGHSGHIDQQLIRSTALSYGEGLYVLCSPASANFAHPAGLALQNLDNFLEACKQAFGYTVIDAPRASMDLAASLAAQSAATLVVFQLNVKDVRIARETLMALAERGVRPDALIPLANRCQKRSSMVTVEDGQRALGAIPMRSIRNDYPSAIRGMNYGQPLGRAAPRSGMLKDIKELTEKLVRAGQAAR